MLYGRSKVDASCSFLVGAMLIWKSVLVWLNGPVYTPYVFIPERNFISYINITMTAKKQYCRRGFFGHFLHESIFLHSTICFAYVQYSINVFQPNECPFLELTVCIEKSPFIHVICWLGNTYNTKCFPGHTEREGIFPSIKKDWRGEKK